MMVPFLIGILIGLVSIAGAIWHEWTWYRRQQDCVRVVGRIIADVSEDSENIRWKIEYEHDGVLREFVSGYYACGERVGDNVKVLLDLQTDTAEHLNWVNRWVLTVFLMLFGLVFIIQALKLLP